MLETAADHADLAFHALAFVPARIDAPALVRAASIHRPAWMRFASERLPRDAVVPIARDAPLVGALTPSAEIAIALQRLATLHDSVAAFLATVRLPLSELDAAAVSRPDDLAELQAVPQPAIELLRGAMALAARSFASIHASFLQPFARRVALDLEPRWAALVAERPGLGPLTLRVSATLGPFGRLVGDTILLGTRSLPDDPAPIDTDGPFALAAHEASVHAAGRALRARGASTPWTRIERVALDAAERAYRGTSVEPAYAAWRAPLDTRGLTPRDADTAACSEEAAHLLGA